MASETGGSTRLLRYSVADLLALLTAYSAVLAIGRVGRHWFGEYTPLIFCCLLLILSYGAVFVIARRTSDVCASAAMYMCVVIMLLPIVYWHVVPWENRFVSPIGKWLGFPVLVFALPTVWVLWYGKLRKRWGIGKYAGVCLLQVIVGFPVWFLAWQWIMLLVGGLWI